MGKLYLFYYWKTGIEASVLWTAERRHRASVARPVGWHLPRQCRRRSAGAEADNDGQVGGGRQKRSDGGGDKTSELDVDSRRVYVGKCDDDAAEHTSSRDHHHQQQQLPASLQSQQQELIVIIIISASSRRSTRRRRPGIKPLHTCRSQHI